MGDDLQPADEASRSGNGHAAPVSLALITYTPALERALGFVGWWDGRVPPGESYQDYRTGIFLHHFLQRWGSLDPVVLRQHLPYMWGEHSAFAASLVMLHDDAARHHYIEAENPWVRWLATLLSAHEHTEALFARLLGMLAEFVDDPRTAVPEADDDYLWLYFMTWYPLVLSSLFAFERPKQVVPVLRQTLQHVRSSQQKARRAHAHGVQRELLGAYQCDLVYELGRYEAWGALVGIEADAPIRAKWLVHLAVGALWRHRPPRPLVFGWRDAPELQAAVREILASRCGLDDAAIDDALAHYQHDERYMSYEGVQEVATFSFSLF